MTIAPVRRQVRTKAPPARAFAIFTAQIGRWWPRGQTVGANPHADIVIEPRVGGRWFERDDAGIETPWGHVLAWDPPGRLVLAWQLDGEKRYDPDLVTEVEITFAPLEDGGTQVTLEHRDLERFRKRRDAWAAQVEEGWTEMVEIFADFANRLPDQEE
jgi:uncharacterized protein YndB with AHSA1/START domain